MKTASPFGSLFATGLLHVALIVLAITGLTSEKKSIVPPKPVLMQLLQEQKTTPAPLPVAPVEPYPSPQQLRKKLPKAKVPPAPNPLHPVREPAPQVDAPVVPFAPAPSAPSTSVIQAPAAQATPASPAPVKTGVSISASYKATNRKPPYPRLSLQNEEQGVVELRVYVKADGTAGEVQIASSSGYPRLNESAKNTVQTWRFNPATIDGKPVGEWYRLSVPFKLND